MSELEQNMQKSVEKLKSELAKIRTGRANPAILDSIMVDYYGTKTPIKNMATLSTPEPKLLVVQPWDVSQIAAIEKAISTSDLGLTPNNDGKVVRIQIPPLTEERRRGFIKVIKKIGEDTRVALRMIRRNANEDLKQTDPSEDEKRKQQDHVQKLTDKYIVQVDALLENKEKELLNV